MCEKFSPWAHSVFWCRGHSRNSFSISVHIFHHARGGKPSGLRVSSHLNYLQGDRQAGNQGYQLFNDNRNDKSEPALALGTKKSWSLQLNNALDCSATPKTLIFRAPVHLVKSLVSTGPIVSCSVCFITDRWTLKFDRLVEYSRACCCNAIAGRLGQPVASCTGINFGLMQNFWSVDIAHTGKYLLVEECNFYVTPWRLDSLI